MCKLQKIQVYYKLSVYILYTALYVYVIFKMSYMRKQESSIPVLTIVLPYALVKFAFKLNSFHSFHT